jgi:hypothetical protein
MDDDGIAVVTPATPLDLAQDFADKAQKASQEAFKYMNGLAGTACHAYALGPTPPARRAEHVKIGMPTHRSVEYLGGPQRAIYCCCRRGSRARWSRT